MILWRNFHFLSFNANLRVPPFLLYVRCKSGVTFVRRCFGDANIFNGLFSALSLLSLIVLDWLTAMLVQKKKEAVIVNVSCILAKKVQK